MSSNFSKSDFKVLENFFKNANENTILTQGPKVLEFEKKFISSGFVFIENQKDIQDNNKNISTNKL